MDALTFIAELRDTGITLAVTDGNLAVGPSSRLTPEHRAFIREHKAELLAALLDAGQPGNDHQPANDGHRASIDALPLRLKAAAVRVCLEIHGDPPEAVEEMLLGLAHCPHESWGWLTSHFESQLPETFDNRRSCRQCLNLSPVGYCRSATNMPNATSTWTPDPDRLRRCLWFAPVADDPDQRTGRDRWPGLELIPGIHEEAAQ